MFSKNKKNVSAKGLTKYNLVILEAYSEPWQILSGAFSEDS